MQQEFNMCHHPRKKKIFLTLSPSFEHVFNMVEYAQRLFGMNLVCKGIMIDCGMGNRCGTY
jgi:hypothetical protein